MKDCKHREGCDPTHSSREPIKNKAAVDVDVHDCDYVNARNRLIARAELEVGRQGISANMGAAYSRAFMIAMDRLAVEAGLVVPVIRPGVLRAVA
jgi:hypothetical protein